MDVILSMGRKLLQVMGCFFVIVFLVVPVGAQGLVTGKSVPVDGSWGFIIKKDFVVTYSEVIQNISGTVSWWGCPTVEYMVLGIGRHSIHYECRYTVFTYDDHVQQPQTGFFMGNDSIYLFNLGLRPIMKPRASDGCLMAFYLFRNGSWTGRLFIDDELVDEQTVEYTHH